jgi:23S rRNA (uracil1939-C5)-methyltransferase
MPSPAGGPGERDRRPPRASSRVQDEREARRPRSFAPRRGEEGDSGSGEPAPKRDKARESRSGGFAPKRDRAGEPSSRRFTPRSGEAGARRPQRFASPRSEAGPPRPENRAPGGRRPERVEFGGGRPERVESGGRRPERKAPGERRSDRRDESGPRRPGGFQAAREDERERRSGSPPAPRGERERRPAGKFPARPARDKAPGKPGRTDRRRPAGQRPPAGNRRPGPRRASLPFPAEPGPPPPGIRLVGVEEAEVGVEKLVAGGEGLARLAGVPLFVPRSVPGDRLRVRVTERHPDYGRAEIVEVLAPGPGRRPDPYPELALTGACDLQHIEDALQPRLKAEAVREALSRLGRIELPPDLRVETGEPWHYRLRTQLHTGVDPETRAVRVGYLARGSHVLVPLARCALLVPELEEQLASLPAELPSPPPRRVDLAAGDGGAVTLSPPVEGLPHGEVSTAVAGFSYSYDARCFFQGHRGLLSRLVDTVVGADPADPGGAGGSGGLAYDLYAGVGLFSLPLCRTHERVIAVEADPIAARYSRLNARRNRLPNLETVSQVVESWIPNLPAGVDRVIVDPPRAGLTSRVRRTLLEKRPRRLTYVSCHAAALARDLHHLSAAYRLESITLFDLFPQTGHMEAVVQLALLS